MKEGIESTTLPITTKLHRIHNCSITDKPPLSLYRLLAAVASTNVQSKDRTKVLNFLIFCAWANLFNFYNKNNWANYQAVTQQTIKWLKKSVKKVAQ